MYITLYNIFFIQCTIWNNTVQLSITFYNMVLHCTTWYYTVQHGITLPTMEKQWKNTFQHGTTLYIVVLH